jgi:diadenylate cyclase
MNSFESLYNQTTFLLSSLTWFGVLDLALVTLAFYFLLSLVRRSSSAYLLREILILGLFLFIVTTLLPLPVFDWLVRGVLVALLVVTPIIFQVPLRRFIERLGRASGIGQSVRQGAAEDVLPQLTHAVEDMASKQTGALIVLEGYDSLEEIAKSGVSLGGRVTSEVLESIFYSGTPLHDGAIIIRTDRILAAGCVLPLTQNSLPAEKRLGTRHRAAVGMSEVSDALVVVVSEETGHISVAQQGILHRPLTPLELRERLVDFYDPTTTAPPSLSLWRLLKQMGRQLWRPAALLDFRQLLSNLGLLFISILLALVVWSFVIEQTDPLKEVRIDNIPLRVENLPPDSKLLPTPPANVSAIVQTTEDVLPTLNGRSFQAVASLLQTEPDLYRLPVQVSSGETQVLILSVEPVALDVELARVISKTFPIIVELSDPESLSAAYQLGGTPTTSPEKVQVVGPAPLVEQVSQVKTTISLANTTTSIRETRILRALDENGQEVKDITLQPAQVQVNLPIRRRLNAREVRVNAIVRGTSHPDYQFSNLTITPTNVTLQGDFEQLSDIGNLVNTAPIDLNEVNSDFTTQVPLDLPDGVQALDSNGNSTNSVTVSINIIPRNGNVSITRPVELLKATPNVTITISPAEVDVLLSGPLPLLHEIRNDPNLVQVLVDTSSLRRGQNADLMPSLVTPPNIEAQIAPPSVLVTFR